MVPLLQLIERYLGRGFAECFLADDTEEVYINTDLRIRVLTSRGTREPTESTVEARGAEAFLRSVASRVKTQFDREHPSLAASCPFPSLGKVRIQGFIPPLTDGPVLLVRKPCRHVPTLEDYVRSGSLSQTGFDRLRAAVAMRDNIIVAGPTGSGKTTLCNALIQAIEELCPGDRLVILEDTPEIVCTAPDHLILRTTPDCTMRELVKYSLRTTPNRIVIGEVRDGAAKDLLDAWITGHPGGCGTVHGEDIEKALVRLSELARDGAGGIDQRALVLRAVQLVVVISGFGSQRRVRQVGRPVGLNAEGFEVVSVLDNPVR